MSKSAAAPLGLKLLVVALFAAGMAFGMIVALDRPVAVGKVRVLDIAKVEPTRPVTPEPARPKPTEPAKPKAKPTEPAKPMPKPTEPAKPVEVAKITFDKDIKGIFKSKCTTCHGDGGAKGGVDLRTLKDAVFNVKPGSLKDSIVWGSISDGSMPPPGKEKLTQAEKNLISKWITSGAE